MPLTTEQEPSSYSRTEKHANHPKKKRKVRKKAVAIIICVIVILIAGALAMAGMSIKPPSLDKLTGDTAEQQEEREDGIYNVLVVGTDKVGLNTDTILVMSLDSINNRANVMSIPRDTMSNVSRNVKKINAAYSIGAKNGKGNIDNLKKEVSYLMGFEVDNYVVINLNAFEEIIDAIGGVTIDVPRDMNYDDPYQDLHIHLSKGLQTLNGQQAIGFVRYRSGYVEGDLGRVKAQQLFIEAVAKQLSSASTVTKMPKLIEIILRNTDTDLTNGEMLWFGKEALEVDMSTDLKMFVLPGEARMVNRLSYYLPNEAEILEIVNEYFNPYATPITSLNIVNVQSGVQKETARQSALTAEQRQQEEALKQQLENEASMNESDLQPEGGEGPTGAGEGTEAGEPTTDGPSAGQDSQNQSVPPGQQNNSGTPSEPQNENNAPVDNEVVEQPPAETPSHGYNTIPGEVLKPDANSQPVTAEPTDGAQ